MECLETFFVTGANGYLGADFAHISKLLGHEVVALVRAGRPDETGGTMERQNWTLGDPFPDVKDVMSPVLVHFAHDWSDLHGSNDNINVTGSRMLFDTFCSRFQHGKILFVSSASARPAGGNMYGQIKYKIETFADLPMTIVRVGLVYSWPPRGQVKTLASLSRLPFTVLPGGENTVYPIPLASVSNCIRQVSIGSQDKSASGGRNRIVVAAGGPVSFKKFIRMLSLAYGNRSPLIVSAPVAPISILLSALAFIGVPVADLLERVRGLAASVKLDGSVLESLNWQTQYSAFESDRKVRRSALLHEARVLLGTVSAQLVGTSNLRAYVRHQERNNHPLIKISPVWTFMPTGLLWLRLLPKITGNPGNSKLIMAIYEIWWLRCRSREGGK
jgi:nucleoside-diphosphate-sugar epimerase